MAFSPESLKTTVDAEPDSVSNRSLAFLAAEYERLTPEQQRVPIEKEIVNLSAAEIVRILKQSLKIAGRFAYHGSLSSWKNLRRIAALLRLSGGSLHVTWGESKGKIAFVSAEFPSQIMDFPVLKQIIDLIILNNSKKDKEFAQILPKIKELFASTTLGKSLMNCTKSGGSTTVFDHMMVDYAERVRTDGLTDEKDKLALRVSFLHDLAKYIFRAPLQIMENNEVVTIDDPELESLIQSDLLDDHGLISALYFSQLWQYIISNQTLEEQATGKYRLFDEDFNRLVTRLFRLHQLAAQMDKAQMSAQDIHELFDGDVEFEKRVLTLVTAMTAFDSSSVASASARPLHVMFSAINPMLVYSARPDGSPDAVKEQQEASEPEDGALTYLLEIIATNIRQAIEMLKKSGKAAEQFLIQLNDFIVRQPAEFSSVFMQAMATTS